MNDSADPLEVLNQKLRNFNFGVVSLLASSSTSEVFRAYRLSDHREFAVKVIDLETIGHKELSELTRRFKLCLDLQLPSLIGHNSTLLSDSHLFIVSELQYAKLSDVLKLSFPDGFKDFRVVCALLKSIVSGLVYIHSHNLTHRNLSSSAVFFRENGDVTLNYFGYLEKDSRAEARSATYRNLCYLPPELFSEQGHCYTKKVDIWSFGILACEVISGRNPFDQYSCYESINRIINDDPPTLKVPPSSDFKKEFLVLVQRCLSKEPTNRPSAFELQKFFDKETSSKTKASLIRDKILAKFKELEKKPTKLPSQRNIPTQIPSFKSNQSQNSEPIMP